MATLTYLTAAVLDPEQRSVDILKMQNVTTSYSNGNRDSSVSVVTRLRAGITRNFCVFHIQSNTTIFHLVVE